MPKIPKMTMMAKNDMMMIVVVVVSSNADSFAGIDIHYNNNNVMI